MFEAEADKTENIETKPEFSEGNSFNSQNLQKKSKPREFKRLKKVDDILDSESDSISFSDMTVYKK